MAIDIGEFNYPIKIEKKNTEINNFGEPMERWLTLFSIRAKKLYRTGTQSFSMEQLQSNFSYVEYTMHPYPGIDYACRIIDDGDIYVIEAIEKLGYNGRDGLKLKCIRSESYGL